MRTLVSGLAGLVLAMGCNNPEVPFDAGPRIGTDAGPPGTDAGPSLTDAGPSGSDAGPGGSDAGPGSADAGPGGSDAGPMGSDAGPMGSDAGPGGTDAGPGGTDAGPGGACPIVGTLTLGVANIGNNSASMNTIMSSCGSTGGLDDVHTFTAATAGLYNFTTEGSAFDTTLTILSGVGCTGMEITCEDDDDYGTTSQAALSLTAGQQVSVVVDGYDAMETGAYAVEVRADACLTATDLMGRTGTNVAMGPTPVGAGHFREGSCDPGNRGGEFYYRWTAPMTRSYRIDTVGSTADTVLYALNGGCAGAELGCNDDTTGLTSEITLSATMGQVVILVVDTLDLGDAILNIAPL